MIWIWFLLRNRYGAAHGPFPHYFTFECAECRRTMFAMAWMFGRGNGRTLDQAQRNAERVAYANMGSAIAAAACPHCGQLGRVTIEKFERATKAAARRRMLGLPFAIGVMLLTAILAGIPAVRDLKDSLLLSVFAFLFSLCLGALTLWLFAQKVAEPLQTPWGVWFSSDPAQGPSSWFQAQGGTPPKVQQPAPVLRWTAGGICGATFVFAALTLFLWVRTFRDVYVLHTNGREGDLQVRIDGHDVGPVYGLNVKGDIPHAKFKVRTGKLHEVVVVEPLGESRYELDPASASHGWVLAPHARQRDLCLVSSTWYYGRDPVDDENDGLLNGTDPGDFVTLTRSFDHVFEPAPAKVETQGSTTRTTLRALDCAELLKDNIVPFRNRRTPVVAPREPLSL